MGDTRVTKLIIDRFSLIPIKFTYSKDLRTRTQNKVFTVLIFWCSINIFNMKPLYRQKSQNFSSRIMSRFLTLLDLGTTRPPLEGVQLRGEKFLIRVMCLLDIFKDICSHKKIVRRTRSSWNNKNRVYFQFLSNSEIISIKIVLYVQKTFRYVINIFCKY